MVSRSTEKLQVASGQVPRSVAIACDVSDSKSVQSMVADVLVQQGTIDVVVNCAGVMYFTLMRNLLYGQWKQTIDTNCTGTVNLCGAVLPHMLSAKTGHVVNVSSD